MATGVERISTSTLTTGDGDERDDSDGDQQEEEGVPVDEALFDAEELDALQIDDEAGED